MTGGFSFSSAAVVQYLLKRSTDSNKEGKEVKYELITALLKHEDVLRETLGGPVTKALHTYHKQGPLYVEPYVETALEELRR